MHPRTPPWHAWLAGMLLVAAWLAAPGCAGKNPIDKVLEELTPPTPGDTARRAFNTYDPDERRRAIALLSAAPWGGEEAYVKLYRTLFDDPDATVRAACAKALGMHGTVDDAKLLVRRLSDENASVRWEVAVALQRVHNPIAVKPLMNAMSKDDDPDVRMAAGYALGQYAEPAVFQALLGALDDPDFGVAENAQLSLVCLTGADFGTDGELWMLWSEKHRGELFKNQQPYTWQPYNAPLHWWQRAQFWREYKPKPPQPPTGLEVETSASGQTPPHS